MMLPPRAAPPVFETEAYDFAEPTPPRHVYMIASTPRAGGTLLSQELWRSGIMGAPDEYFGFYSTFLRLVARLGPDTIEDYLQRLMPLRTTANGVFGFKAHYDHLQFLLLTGILARFPKLKIIAIERRDLLAQAAWLRALARRLVPDPVLADDLAQDTCVAALEKMGVSWLTLVLPMLWRRRRCR